MQALDTPDQADAEVKDPEGSWAYNTAAGPVEMDMTLLFKIRQPPKKIYR